MTAVIQHETARQAPLRLGAGTVVTSQDLPTPTERLLEPDQRGYDVILDTLWGPVIPAAVEAAAAGARVVHLGNSAGALATLAGPTVRKNGVSILPYAIFTLPTQKRSGAFARAGRARRSGGTDRRIPRNRTRSAPALLGRLRGRAGGHQDHRQAE